MSVSQAWPGWHRAGGAAWPPRSELQGESSEWVAGGSRLQGPLQPSSAPGGPTAWLGSPRWRRGAGPDEMRGVAVRTDLPPGSGRGQATLFSSLGVPTLFTPSARGTTTNDPLCVPRPRALPRGAGRLPASPSALTSHCATRHPLLHFHSPGHRVTMSRSSLSLGAHTQSLAGALASVRQGLTCPPSPQCPWW